MNGEDPKHPARTPLWKPLLSILVLACLSIGTFLIVSQHYMNVLFKQAEQQNRRGLMYVISVARHAVEPVLIKVRSGEINREEAIRRIRPLIRSMTYQDQDGPNYIFMTSYDGTMLVQPYDLAMEMTNPSEIRDVKGFYIAKALIKAAKTHPEGSFVRYYYSHLPDVPDVQERLTYIVGLPEIECYLGTGMYLGRVIRQERELLSKIEYASLGLLFVVLIPVSAAIIIILNRNRRLLAEVGIRHKAEEEIRMLAAIVRHSRELVSLADMDGQMIYLNETGSKILGIDPENLATTSIMQVIPDHLKDLVEQKMLPALTAGGSWEGDLQYVNLKTGILTDVHALTFAIDDPQAGQHRYLANISLDVSRHKQADEKFAKIFMLAPDGISITRMADGLIVDTNLGFEAISGWERSEVLGRTSLEVNFWADPADRALLVEDLKAGRDVLQREFQFRRKDGTVRSGMYSARSIQIAGEACLVFVMQDITGRKETERMLRENEERLRGITANIPGVVYQFYAKDTNAYGISYTSDGIRDVFGLSVESAAMYPAFLAHVHGQDRDRFLASIQAAVEKCSPWNFEGRFVKPSGEMIWFQGLSTPTRHADGLVFDGILLDITARKQAEEKFRQAEDKFAKIFMTTPDCIAITRMQDGRIMDVNQGFEDILGWRRDEVLGRTALDINVWGDPAERGRMVEDLKAGRDVLYRETLFRRKEGVMRNVVYSARSIQIVDELCIIFVMQDMTDRKILENDRRKLEQQLYQSQKMDAIGQLASGVAHDFNNILTGIQGNASLMMLDYDPGHPHYQRLSQIEEQVRRGANLTRQLLGFARGGKYEVKTVAVNDLIRKTAQFFLETKREIEADYRLQEDVYPVEADAGQIEQVLVNLFINAGHAMPNGGSLHIQTANITLTEAEARAFDTPPGDYVRISVTDTGIGMDHETLTRIFEPFFTTRSQQGGTGLGLASSYGIVRNHGGAMHAYSEPGKGSTFTLYLPSSLNKIEEDRAPDKDLHTGSGTILLVDDEPLILDIASSLLRKLGYTVYQSASGHEAVQTYREQYDRIDLVILDMIMPGMSGSQTLQGLRDINPAVKVILSSGYSLQGEVQKIMETGCQGFIQKPYLLADLSAIVHRVLQSEEETLGDPF